MKIESISLTALNLGADATSEPFFVGHAAIVALQLVNTGTTPAGTFKLQASCDKGLINASERSNQDNGLTNWTDIASASAAITDVGTVLFNIVDPGYHWIRVVYTRSSGTGASAIRVNTKGV